MNQTKHHGSLEPFNSHQSHRAIVRAFDRWPPRSEAGRKHGGARGGSPCEDKTGAGPGPSKPDRIGADLERQIRMRQITSIVRTWTT